MLNNYYLGGNTNNQKCVVNLNAPSSGFIQKSNPVSRFIRFQRGSEIERNLFPTDPRQNPSISYKESEWSLDKKEEVIVLQVCIFGNDYMLAEYVLLKDIEDK